MKLTPVVLGVSIAANAALLVVVVSRPAAVDDGTEMSADRGGAATHLAGNDGVSLAGTDDRGSAGAGAERKGAGMSLRSWQSLRERELKDVVAELRAAGYPAAAIRGIIHARVKAQFDARAKELLAGVEQPAYWTRNRFGFDPKVLAAQRELQQEQHRLMRELLGPDAVEENEFSRYHRQRQFGEISAEKAEEAGRIMGDYSELRSEIYNRAGGMLLPEDREQIDFLEKSMREDMAGVLTPEERENYELRSSNTAGTLRAGLTFFAPSESEFRALYQAAKTVEEKFGSPGPSSWEKTQQRQAALNELAKQVLPPERYAEFELATNPLNTQLNRVVARYGLSPTVVPEVNAVRQDLQVRAAQLRSLPPGERATQSAALAQEAATRLSPLLGERAFAAYKEYGGQWIESLTQVRSEPPARIVPPSGAGGAAGGGKKG